MSGCTQARPSVSSVFAEFYSRICEAAPEAFAETLEIHVSERLFAALESHFPIRHGAGPHLLAVYGGNGGGIHVRMAPKTEQQWRAKPSDGGRAERKLYDAALKAMSEGIRDAMSAMPEDSKQAEQRLYGAVPTSFDIAEVQRKAQERQAAQQKAVAEALRTHGPEVAARTVFGSMGGALGCRIDTTKASDAERASLRMVGLDGQLRPTAAVVDAAALEARVRESTLRDALEVMKPCSSAAARWDAVKRMHDEAVLDASPVKAEVAP